MADSFSEEQKATLRAGFDMFDRDGNGYISSSELGAVIKSLGQEPTTELLKAMIAEADLDASGHIDFNEFLKMINNKMQILKK